MDTSMKVYVLVVGLVLSLFSVLVRAEQPQQPPSQAQPQQGQQKASFDFEKYKESFFHYANYIKPEYVVGGMSINTVDRRGVEGESAGMHFYMGYQVPEKYVDMSKIPFGDKTYDLSWIELKGEVGYARSGKVEVDLPTVGTTELSSLNGLWISSLLEVPLADEFSLMARLGLDFGDDNGWVYGAGGQYNLNKSLGLRLEYVLRDLAHGTHVNLVYKL